MYSENAIFNRTGLLLGDSSMQRIKSANVILFGVGGVGSWCAEALVRTGIGHLTIVDPDCVCVSNINRQLPATTKTIGKPKVEALLSRLQEISPSTVITAIQRTFNTDTADSFNLESYDYIIDAIDSLANKALLIRLACNTKATFFSSMGAALKLDPAKVAVSEFWNVRGCPLARALRQYFKKNKLFPKHKFQCVYSDELLPNEGTDIYQEEYDKPVNSVLSTNDTDNDVSTSPYSSAKKANGSLVHITAIFGMTLAGLVIQDIHKNNIKRE
ncbi:MAG: ThiF family adenylyltransferase [Prevotella sp.]